MKITFAVLFAVCSFYSATALPRNAGASDPNRDAEVVVVPLERQPARLPARPSVFTYPFGGGELTADQDEDGQIDAVEGPITTGLHPTIFSSYFPQSLNPYNWEFAFVNRIQNLVRQLWEQAQIPTGTSGFGTDFTTDFDGFGSDVPETKDGESNTTSTIKIINGQKFMVNETVYRKKTMFGESVYRIQTIDALSDDSDNETSSTNAPIDEAVHPTHVAPKESVTPTRTTTVRNHPTRESEADDLERGSPEVTERDQIRHNEISKEIDDNVESFEVDAHNDANINNQPSSSPQQEQVSHPMTPFEKLQQLIDPTTIQPILPVDKDTEMESNEQHEDNVQKFTDALFDDETFQPQSISDASSAEHHGDGSLDGYEQFPVDLSNDIAVNQMLADQGAPFNPDAEVFIVDDVNGELAPNSNGGDQQYFQRISNRDIK